MNVAPRADAAGHEPERLRALLHGELRLPERLRCRWHLRRCADCAATLARLRRDEARVDALLESLSRDLDVEAGWHRVRGPAGSGRATLARLAIWLAVVLAAVGIAVGVRARSGDEVQAATLHDRCCWDLDGGGPGDDGVVAVTLPGERVVQLTVYEDTNRSGSLTASDRIRFGMVEALRAMARADAERTAAQVDDTIVRDACCADHDGGGDPDDGLLTVNRPGEVVDSVLLYEDADGSGGWSAGDLILWTGGAAPVTGP